MMLIYNHPLSLVLEPRQYEVEKAKPLRFYKHQHSIITGTRTCSVCGQTLLPKVPKRS